MSTCAFGVYYKWGCGQALQNGDTVHLIAGGEHQSQDCDWEGFKTGAQRCARASVQRCGVRGNKSVPTERERCTTCVLWALSSARRVAFKGRAGAVKVKSWNSTCVSLLCLKTPLLLICSRRVLNFGCRVHAGRNLAAAGELQHAAERQLFIFVRACKLGANDPAFGLQSTETRPQSNWYQTMAGYRYRWLSSRWPWVLAFKIWFLAPS